MMMSVGLCCLGAAEPVVVDSTQAQAEGDLLWYDCRKLYLEGRGWTDTEGPYDRLPARMQGKAPELDWRFGRCSAGLCVFFSTDAPSFQVRWTLRPVEQLAMVHMPATGVSGLDLYRKLPDGSWRFVNNGRPTGMSNNTASFTAPPNSECLLYFPLYNGVESIAIGIPKQNRLLTLDKASLKDRKTVVYYGTSIVQGACASRPGMAFTAMVGRRLNVQIINLGFSGSGKMEPAMASLLAELDPSMFVLDCLWNMTAAEVTERTGPMVKTLRAAHPDTPILLVEEANIANACPTERGVALRAVFNDLTAKGVKNLHLMPSRDVLGDDGEASVDCVHPNDLGMKRQADAVVKTLGPLLETNCKP